MDATTASVPQAVSDGILSVEPVKTTKRPGCDHPLRVYAVGNTYCRNCTRWLGRGDLREAESLPGGTVLRHQLAQMAEEGGGEESRILTRADSEEHYPPRAKDERAEVYLLRILPLHQASHRGWVEYLSGPITDASPREESCAMSVGYEEGAVARYDSLIAAVRELAADHNEDAACRMNYPGTLGSILVPGAVEELVAATQALVDLYLVAPIVARDPADGGETRVCAFCMRAELGGTLTHAESCKVGRVLKAVGAVRQAGNESRWDAHKQTITAEKHAKLDAHACGDCLYDPSIDRSLVCTLNSGHEGMHFDAEDQRNWQGDDVDSIRRCVVAPGGMEYEARGAEDIHGVGYAVAQADGDSGKAESDVKSGARVFRDVPKPDAKLQVLLRRPRAYARLSGIGWFVYDGAAGEFLTLTRVFDTEQAAWDAAWAHLSPAIKQDTHLGAVEVEAAR